MRRTKLTMVAVAVGLLLATQLGGVAAQQPPKAGPEVQVMEGLVGHWQAKVKFWLDPKMPPQESEGMMVRKLIIGGKVLQEEFKGTFAGAPFEGLGLMCYDPQKKKYVGTWVDSMSGTIAMMDSTYDTSTKTFSGTMDEIDPMTGKKMKSRDVVRIVNNDHQIQEMFSTPEGGKEAKMMEIHYHRVKEDKKKR